MTRKKQLTSFERQAREQGFLRIAGIDEAGRGPLAGPVVAAACILPEDFFIDEADDSKKLTPEARERVFEKLTKDPRVLYGVGIIDHKTIDDINIFQATVRAMFQAVEKLLDPPDYLLVDGLKLPHPVIPSQKIIKGDQLSHSIACASIIAKVTRDRLMIDLHEHYPDWNFKQHKGYSTPEHLKMIEKYGASPVHRLSFAPLKLDPALTLVKNI